MSITRDWADYIRNQLDRRDRIVRRAVAEVVVEEERARIAEIAELRERVITLESELRAINERSRGLRSVPASGPSAMIA